MSRYRVDHGPYGEHEAERPMLLNSRGEPIRRIAGFVTESSRAPSEPDPPSQAPARASAAGTTVAAGGDRKQAPPASR